jgi:replication factor C subunit 2/4
VWCRVQIIEAIQSRCAILRYTKLSDAEVLERLLEVVEAEKVAATDDGLEALVFTAQGDMRQVGSPLRSMRMASEQFCCCV